MNAMLLGPKFLFVNIYRSFIKTKFCFIWKKWLSESKVRYSWSTLWITPNVIRKCCIIVPFSSTHSYATMNFLSWLPSKQGNTKVKETFTVLGLRPNPDFTRLYRSDKSTITTNNLAPALLSRLYHCDISQVSLLNFSLLFHINCKIVPVYLTSI
jgi:hypothetical protein